MAQIRAYTQGKNSRVSPRRRSNMTTPQIEKVVKSPVLALQERANAGGHLNAGEIGKLLDANFPEPAFTDLAGQWGSGSKVPGTGSVEPVPPAAAILSPAPQPATKASC